MQHQVRVSVQSSEHLKNVSAGDFSEHAACSSAVTFTMRVLACLLCKGMWQLLYSRGSSFPSWCSVRRPSNL